jgi:hypothetical protein
MRTIKEIIEAGLDAIKESGKVNGLLYHDFIYGFNQTFPKTPFNPGCGSCLADAFYALKTNYTNKNTPMEIPTKIETQFHIANDGVPYVDKLGLHVSNTILSDDIAFQMLNISENFAAIFDKKPVDWKEQLENWIDEKAKSKIKKEVEPEVKAPEAEAEPETSAPKQNNFNKKKR